MMYGEDSDSSKPKPSKTSNHEMRKVKTTLKTLEYREEEKDEQIIVDRLLSKTIHSEVYQGETSSGAVRALISPGIDDPEVVEEFVHSCQTAIPLKHYNIVKVYDLVELNHKSYAVCELVEAVNLRDLVSSIGAFDTKQEFFHVFNQVLEAIRYAHGMGVVHGNLKPSNILLCERDGEVTVKVTEFARAKFKAVSLAKQGIRPDTDEVVYWSPELSKQKDPNKASDIYQLGLLIYYSLTGELPYDYKNPDSVLKAHTDNNIKIPIVEDTCQIGNLEELNEILQEACDSDPEWRIQSIEDLQERLTDWFRLSEEEVDLGQMSLDDMIEEADSASITPTSQKKVSTTIHNLVALKKKQQIQDDTVLMKLSDKVSAKGPRLSPTQSIVRVGAVLVAVILLATTVYYITLNHSNEASFVWKQASLKLASINSDAGLEEDSSELVIEDEGSADNKPESVSKAGLNSKSGSVRQSRKVAKRARKPKYIDASEFYKNRKFTVTNNALATQGKSNRRIIDYTEFDENWLK